MGLSDASPSEAFSLLTTQHVELLDAVFAGTCVPWCGSGISRTRYPNVQRLLELAINLLFSRADPANADCPFISALTEVLDLAGHHTLDPRADPAVWPVDEKNRVLSRLVDQYANALAVDVPIAGGTFVSLRWDLLDLVSLYSDPTVEPDLEHHLLAILAEEGVFAALVTTNWDGLIELASTKVSRTGAPTIASVANASDFQLCKRGTSVPLYKIHGCAVKSKADEANYKPYLLSVTTDLAKWERLDPWAPFRDVVATIMRTATPVLLGLSVQDFNLQAKIIDLSMGLGSRSTAVPQVYFCGGNMTAHYRSVCSSVYGQQQYSANRPGIDAKSLVPLYGKPLLGALFITTLLKKLDVVIELGQANFRLGTQQFCERMRQKIKVLLLNFLDSRHVATDADASWTGNCDFLTRFVNKLGMLFFNQTMPVSWEAYTPILHGSVQACRQNAVLASIGLHWLAWMAFLLLDGHEAGLWQAAVCEPVEGCSELLTLHANGVSFLVHIVGDARLGYSRLEGNGYIDVSRPSRYALFYPSGSEPRRSRRSPAKVYPGASHINQVVEIWGQDLYDDSVDDLDAIDAIKSMLV